MFALGRKVLLPLMFAALVPSFAVGCASPDEDDATGAAAAASEDTDAITLDNWETHTEIARVLGVVYEVETAMENHELTATVQENVCGDEVNGEAQRAKFVDANGKLRKLQFDAGTEDTFGGTHVYYDANGTLRLVLIQWANVHNWASDHQVFFDASGRRIWEVISTEVSGESSDEPKTHHEPEPSEVFEDPGYQSDPESVFTAPPRCG